MEVYLGEEYCGTSRGKNVCTVLDDRAAKDPDAVAVKHHNPDKVWWAKNSQAKDTTMESYPSLQCCEGCRMYGSFDALPPCCCDTNEGL
ncbi:protein FAM24A [Macaca mulatta]